MTDTKNQNADVVREKLADAQTPGYQAEFDPEEAERAGAFVEDALSEVDAADSNADLLDLLGEEQPGFLDDEGPSAEIPTFITRINVGGLTGGYDQG